jgi:CRP/FNR family transcriptional regulator, cyclic AMP receptor protein
VTAIAAIFGCDEALAGQLDRSVVPLAISHKTVIAHQGDPADQCWLVIDGTVHIQLIGFDGQKVQLAYHGPGEFFGAYPDHTTHRADIVAHGEVHALRIPTDTLAAMSDEHAPIGAGLARRLGRQLDMSLDRMAARSTLSAPGRVHAELLRLAGEKNRIEPAPKVTALALNANTTRETASRAVSALERRGVIERTDECMTIVSPRMLRDMVY